MTVKHYDHTIIDHTDVPTNPLPQHVRIATSDPKTTPGPIQLSGIATTDASCNAGCR